MQWEANSCVGAYNTQADWQLLGHSISQQVDGRSCFTLKSEVKGICMSLDHWTRVNIRDLFLEVGVNLKSVLWEWIRAHSGKNVLCLRIESLTQD